MFHSPRLAPIHDRMDANARSTKPIHLHLIVALVLGIGLFLPAAAVAQKPASSLDALKQDQPGFYVRASCDHASGIYEEGEALNLTVKCEADAYVYVMYEQADGKKFQIFPNSGQPDNRVAGGKEVRIPAKGDLFRWTVTPPFGKEKVVVIASKKPLESLSRPEQTAKAFNAISDKDVKGAALELGKQEEKTWTEHSIEITTMARQTRPQPTAGRRFGLFAGVSDYKFGPKPLNFAVSDTTKMAQTFEDVGGVPPENLFILKDRQATKAALQDYITRRLPSMTRPGDTVFIYFSGHGGRTLDEPEGVPGHDEADIWEELLCNWDFFGWEEYEKFRALDAKGELQPELVEIVRRITEKRGQGIAKFSEMIAEDRQALEKLKDRPDDDTEKKDCLTRIAIRSEFRNSMVVKESGISDDEFGHWLQSLDGRQVIVILDVCQAGGFDQNAKQPITKELQTNGRKKGFDFNFLGGEVDRLKDIGQRDMALMAAAPAELPSIESSRIGGSIFGQHLMQVIRDANSTLTFDAAYQQVKSGMAEWFATHPLPPNFKPHEPTQANYCTKMPILRP